MVLIVASDPRFIWMSGSIRKMTLARLSESTTRSTVPILTPAMRTADFSSRPATESKSAESVYPFASPNSYFPTIKVMMRRVIDPTMTSNPTFASALRLAMKTPCLFRIADFGLRIKLQKR